MSGVIAQCAIRLHVLPVWGISELLCSMLGEGRRQNKGPV